MSDKHDRTPFILSGRFIIALNSLGLSLFAAYGVAGFFVTGSPVKLVAAAIMLGVVAWFAWAGPKQADLGSRGRRLTALVVASILTLMAGYLLYTTLAVLMAS